jgi:hypothetical protein
MLGKRTASEYAAGWQCVHPGNIKLRETNVVTGKERTEYHWLTCYDVREAFTTVLTPGSSCGPAGLWFQLYVKPDFKSTTHNAGGKASAEALLDELENL